MNHEDERFSYFLRCGHFYASLPSSRPRKNTVSPAKSWYMAFSQLQDFRRYGCYFKIDCKCSSKIPLTNNFVKSWLGTCWSTLTHNTSRGDFWVFKHLKVIENGRLDLVRPSLDRLFRQLRFRWLNWNTSLKGNQGKAAPNPIVYFQSP